ncbi:MAG: hypothetical protein JXP37_00435 [Coriobacteriia bacterium]|nr:hypothetical protein [Coriobacteriia bacterium]
MKHEEASSLEAALAQRFEAEQEDLDALCAPRDWSRSEIFLSNEYYGIASVLKRYAEYDRRHPVKAVIPHGVYLNDHELADSEREAGLAAALVYPPYRSGLYRDCGRMAEIPSAAPFVYAERLLTESWARTGTLFFPAHSLPGLTAEMDFEGAADELRMLPARMRPVTVIMYWHDYLLGRHRPFAERGYRIVSAGHMFDPDFLLRLGHLLKTHTYAISNAIGSHVFYSVQAGCIFRLVEMPYRYVGSEEDFRLKAPALTDERKAAVDSLSALFSQDVTESTTEQRQMVDYYLGLEHALQPPELRDLLEWFERLDRFGRAFLWYDDGRRFQAGGTTGGFVPAGLRRLVMRSIPSTVERVARHLVSSGIALLRRAMPFLRNVRLRGRSS